MICISILKDSASNVLTLMIPYLIIDKCQTDSQCGEPLPFCDTSDGDCKGTIQSYL